MRLRSSGRSSPGSNASSPSGPVVSVTVNPYQIECRIPLWITAVETLESCGQPCGGPHRALDVKEPDVLGVALDERAPRLDILAHQNAEQLVGRCGVVEADL